MRIHEKVNKPINKWLVGIITIIMVFAVAGCSGETEVKEKNKENKVEKKTEKDTTSYTADNAFLWLNESGLVSGEGENVTEQFKGSEGLVKAIRTDEADIMEFKKDENAAKYHNPDMNSYAVKNIYILIKKGQDNADNFVKVLESGKAVTELEMSYSSEEQKKVAGLMENGSDFMPVVDAYYALPKDQKSATWDSFMSKNIVTWSGTIADLEAISDSIVVYGKDDYNGEDWTTISTEKKDMMPYTFIVELKDESVKKDLKQGDKVTLKASLDSRGDKEMQYNWKLYEGEVVK